MIELVDFAAMWPHVRPLNATYTYASGAPTRTKKSTMGVMKRCWGPSARQVVFCWSSDDVTLNEIDPIANWSEMWPQNAQQACTSDRSCGRSRLRYLRSEDVPELGDLLGGHQPAIGYEQNRTLRRETTDHFTACLQFWNFTRGSGVATDVPDCEGQLLDQHERGMHTVAFARARHVATKFARRATVCRCLPT